MGACRTENFTQATFSTRSVGLRGPVSLALVREDAPHQRNPRPARRGLKQTQVGGEDWLSVTLYAPHDLPSMYSRTSGRTSGVSRHIRLEVGSSIRSQSGASSCYWRADGLRSAMIWHGHGDCVGQGLRAATANGGRAASCGLRVSAPPPSERSPSSSVRVYNTL